MPYKKVERQPMKMLLQAYDIKSGRELARRLGVSVSAGERKFKNTRLLTIQNLETLNAYRAAGKGPIPIEAIREAIGARA